MILHTTGGRDLPTDLAGLANANGGDAGAHYIVGRTGHVTKLCDDRFATFHGNPGYWQSYWQGERLINEFSVGDRDRQLGP